jgi:hypothetical protein
VGDRTEDKEKILPKEEGRAVRVELAKVLVPPLRECKTLTNESLPLANSICIWEVREVKFANEHQIL